VTNCPSSIDISASSASPEYYLDKRSATMTLSLREKLEAQYNASQRTTFRRLPQIPRPLLVTLGIAAWIYPVLWANSYVTYNTTLVKQVVFKNAHAQSTNTHRIIQALYIIRADPTMQEWQTTKEKSWTIAGSLNEIRGVADLKWTMKGPQGKNGPDKEKQRPSLMHF
jgi:hypothetical protein